MIWVWAIISAFARCWRIPQRLLQFRDAGPSTSGTCQAVSQVAALNGFGEGSSVDPSIVIWLESSWQSACQV